MPLNKKDKDNPYYSIQFKGLQDLTYEHLVYTAHKLKPLIEDAIKTTLVIENKDSIRFALDKIISLFDETNKPTKKRIDEIINVLNSEVK